MSEHEKKTLIAELTEKLAKIENHESELEIEAKGHAEIRDKLHDRMKDVRNDVFSLRTQRDELNSKVKDLKQRLGVITATTQARFDEVQKLHEETRALVGKKPAKSHEALKKEVEKIDWTIQTTPLTLQEDKELVGQVKQLEMQLAIHKKLEQSNKKMAQLRAEINTMKSEKQLLRNQLVENVQKSQETHKKMLEKIEEAKKLKSEADAKHEEFLQSKKKIQTIKEEIRMIVHQIRQLRTGIKEEIEKQRKQNENLMREILESQAREKLKHGGRLTWEEFQLLADKETSEED